MTAPGDNRPDAPAHRDALADLRDLIARCFAPSPSERVQGYAWFDREIAPALAEHDRQVRAAALIEAADAASGRWNVKPYVDEWLRSRAAAVPGDTGQGGEGE